MSVTGKEIDMAGPGAQGLTTAGHLAHCRRG
ncbi:UNVERIFIED_ORG: hypothetical protein CLV66_12746 [Actinomadura viridilutea]